MEEQSCRAPEPSPEDEGYYAVIPNHVLRDPQLKPNAKLLYAKISVLCKRDGYCFASNAFFAEQFQMTERAIRNFICQLEEYGYIFIEHIQEGNDKQSQIRKIYISIDVLEVLRAGRNFPVLRNKFSAAAEQIFRANKVLVNNTSLPPISPTGDGGRRRRKKEPEPDYEPERFARFWDYYKSLVPKGKRIGSKQAAQAAWNKLRPDEPLLRAFFAALKAQSATDDWQRGIGISYVSTWLNGHYWEENETGTAEKDVSQEQEDGDRRWI